MVYTNDTRPPIYDFRSAEQAHLPPQVCIGHGNGFPPEMYQPLAQALGVDYPAICLPARPWWPDSDPNAIKDWSFLAHDLAEGLEAHDLAPIIGVGHSMSGVGLAMAAAKYPTLFRAIILIDPVFLPPLWVSLGRLLRYFRQPFKHMVEGTLRRRREWPNRQAAYDHFRKRSLFQNCSDEMVRLYAEGITRPLNPSEPDGTMTLAYPPEWEARIFGHMSYNQWRYPKKITVPCLLIAGANSDTFLPPAQAAWGKRRPDIPLIKITEAGHLVPFEQPEASAAAIRAFLAQAL